MQGAAEAAAEGHGAEGGEIPRRRGFVCEGGRLGARTRIPPRSGEGDQPPAGGGELHSGAGTAAIRYPARAALGVNGLALGARVEMECCGRKGSESGQRKMNGMVYRVHVGMN